MREIKFRVWDEVNKLMRSDIAAIDFEKRKIYFVNEANTLNSDEHREFWHEPFELMQYTGLKDINSREIFEGDELKNAEGVTYKVMYKDGSFVLYNADYIVTTPRISKAKINRDGLEIIGNTYENKELLD